VWGRHSFTPIRRWLDRGGEPDELARTQLARVLVAAHGGTLFGARESVGRGQRLIARFPL